MPFFVIKKGLVLLEWKYFPTPKILDPEKYGELEFYSFSVFLYATLRISGSGINRSASITISLAL